MSPLDLLSQRFFQGADGVAAVADELFLFEFHLRERAGFAVGHEQRIVAESHVAYGAVVDFAAAFAFEYDGFADGEVPAGILGDGLVGEGAKVACLAVGNPFELFQQKVVVLVVVAVAAAVAGAVDARLAVQGENLEPGVVGEYGRLDAALGEPAGRGARLDDGVFGERFPVFDDFFIESDVLQGLEFVVVRAQDVGEIPDFPAASGGDDEKMLHEALFEVL